MARDGCPPMSELARPTNTLNPMADPRVYFRVSAFLLAAVAVLGVVLNLVDAADALSFGSHFLTLTWTHTLVHFVLAAACFLFGFANMPGRTVKVFALVFGVVYLGLGVLGFFAPNPLGGGLALDLGLGTNLVHILLGGWALAAGITAKYA
jgi:hypothetical protein